MERLILDNVVWNIDDLIETIRELTDDYWEYYKDISNKCSELKYIGKDTIVSSSLLAIYLIQAGAWKFTKNQEYIERLFTNSSDDINRGNPSIHISNRLYYDLNEVLTEAELSHLKKSVKVESEVKAEREVVTAHSEIAESVDIAVAAEQQISSATEGTITPELEPTSRQPSTSFRYNSSNKRITKVERLLRRIVEIIFPHTVSSIPIYAIVSRDFFGNLTEEWLRKDRRLHRLMAKHRRDRHSTAKHEKGGIDVNV